MAFFAGRSQTLLDIALGRSIPSPINWDSLLSQAVAQQVLPSLSAIVHPAVLIPSEIQAVLETTESLNADRNRIMLAEAIHIARLLNQMGIEPVALKGLAYLLSDVFPNQGARYLLDLDFLLPSADLPRAVAHLRAHGYFENESDLFVELRHHQPALRRANRPLIELHHSLVTGSPNRVLPVADIFAQSTRLEIEGATIRIPCPTHLAAHLILHSQLAHPYRDRVFPAWRALLDLAALQKRWPTQISWPSIERSFASAGYSSTFHLHLAQACQILVCEPPLPLQLSLFRRLRLLRRQILYRHRLLRFIDPVYLALSIFSRRIRLVPGLLRSPHLWSRIANRLLQSSFYLR